MNMQQAFSEAVLNPTLPCPQGVISPKGDAVSRFAVYRNNVQRGLIGALSISYPVVSALVGEDFFQEMAQKFIQKFPPDNPVMSTYGRYFADFIQGFSPAESVPYLADVARLERLCVQAYHAADAQPVSLQLFTQALNSPETLGQLHVKLHPSIATLHTPYAVVAIWAAHQGNLQVQSFDPYQPQSTLVLRNGLHVEVLAVSSGCVAFIRSLSHGRVLQQAASYALETNPDFDLNQALALLITRGAITHLQPAPEV